MRAAPRFTHADRLRALAESQRRYAARGVTAVYEGHGIAPEVLAVYREARERGQLRLRAWLAVSPTWDAAEARDAIRRSWPRGRAAAASATTACASAGSVCTAAATPRSRASSTRASPTRAGRASSSRRTSPTAYREQCELAAAARAPREHHRHALPAAGARTSGRRSPRAARSRRLRWVLVHLHVATPDGPRAHPAARRRRHDQPDQLPLALGSARRPSARGSARDDDPAPEPGAARHPVRHRHRQQARRPVARVPGRGGAARHEPPAPMLGASRAAHARAGPARPHRGRRVARLRRARARRARARAASPTSRAFDAGPARDAAGRRSSRCAAGSPWSGGEVVHGGRLAGKRGSHRASQGFLHEEAEGIGRVVAEGPRSTNPNAR